MKLGGLRICTLCICLMLVGCSNKSVSNTINNAQKANVTGNKVDKLNYSSISKGIWISERNEGEDDLFLYINHIDSKFVEGELFYDKLPVSSYYYYNQSIVGKYPWNLEVRDIRDKEKFKYSNDKGNIILEFGDEKILAYIKLLHGFDLNQNLLDFRPLTLDNVIAKIEENGTNASILNKHIVNGKIDKWGNVQLIPIMIQSDKKHPLLFLANENNEILYQFDAPFQNGLDVTGLSIEDINGDKLYDITVILCDNDKSIGGVVAWVFLQTEGNMFCVDYKVQNELNTKFYDAQKLDVRTIKEYFEAK